MCTIFVNTCRILKMNIIVETNVIFLHWAHMCWCDRVPSSAAMLFLHWGLIYCRRSWCLHVHRLGAWFCNKPCDWNWQGFETRSKQTRPIQNGLKPCPTIKQSHQRWESLILREITKHLFGVISCYPLLSNVRKPLWNLSFSFRL